MSHRGEQAGRERQLVLSLGQAALVHKQMGWEVERGRSLIWCVYIHLRKMVVTASLQQLAFPDQRKGLTDIC